MEFLLELVSLVLTLLFLHIFGKLVASSSGFGASGGGMLGFVGGFGFRGRHSDGETRVAVVRTESLPEILAAEERRGGVRCSPLESREDSEAEDEGNEDFSRLEEKLEAEQAREIVESRDEASEEVEMACCEVKLVEQESFGGSAVISEIAREVFGESSERENACEESETDVPKCGVEIEVAECEEEGDWDWVGIERTELEMLFGSAMAFVGSTSVCDRVLVLDNDVKTKLYGLHKIATQGPCFEPQPMALKVSARAKWNAWQQLGEMTREMAMEQYVSLLSKSIPQWMENELKGDGKRVLVDSGNERKLEEIKP